MNSKERVRRAFHFRKPDRVPMSCINLKTDFFPITQIPPQSWQPKNYPPHVSINSIANFLYRRIVYRWRRKFRKQLKYPKNWWKYPHYSIDEWNIIWKSSGTTGDDLTKGHPFKGPLQENWDNLYDYEIPDALNPERYRFIKTGIWKVLGRKRYTIGHIGINGFFNLCSQIRGFNNLLIDFQKNPKKVAKLIEKIQPFYLSLIERYKKYYPTLDSIYIDDDMGTQHSPFISPQIFNKFFKFPYRKMIDLTHDFNMDFILHSCGQIYELMPTMVDMGVDVFEFDSPHMTGIENFKTFAEEKKAAFWLSSNIQSTYLLETPEDVEGEIKLYIKHIGNNKGGLAIYEYPSNKTLGTPKENIIAQRNATWKWGKYNNEGIIEWLT